MRRIKVRLIIAHEKGSTCTWLELKVQTHDQHSHSEILMVCVLFVLQVQHQCTMQPRRAGLLPWNTYMRRENVTSLRRVTMDVNQYMLRVNVDTPMWSRYVMIVETDAAWDLVYTPLTSKWMHTAGGLQYIKYKGRGMHFRSLCMAFTIY